MTVAKDAQCSVRGCRGRKVGGLRWCLKHAVAKCDDLFSKLTRSAGFCANCGTSNNLQCAHGFSRIYHNVRWDFNNAWPLCAGCHKFFTHHPVEWEIWMLDRLGDKEYACLRARAVATAHKPDMERVYKKLVQRDAIKGSL